MSVTAKATSKPCLEKILPYIWVVCEALYMLSGELIISTNPKIPEKISRDMDSIPQSYHLKKEDELLKLNTFNAFSASPDTAVGFKVRHSSASPPIACVCFLITGSGNSSTCAMRNCSRIKHMSDFCDKFDLSVSTKNLVSGRQIFGVGQL